MRPSSYWPWLREGVSLDSSISQAWGLGSLVSPLSGIIGVFENTATMALLLSVLCSLLLGWKWYWLIYFPLLKKKKLPWNVLCGCCLVTKSCLFCDPMDCRPPGSSVHGLSQARILEWVSFSRGSSQPEDWFCVSCIGRWILYHQEPQRKPEIYFTYYKIHST